MSGRIESDSPMVYSGADDSDRSMSLPGAAGEYPPNLPSARFNNMFDPPLALMPFGTAFVTSIVTSAIEALKTILTDEGSVRNLNTIQAFLIEVDKWPIDTAGAQAWIYDLVELGNRAENLVLEHSHRGRFFSSLKRRAFFPVSLHRSSMAAKNISSELKNLMKRLESISRGERIHVPRYQLRITYPFETERNFVGVEGNLSRIITLVNDVDKPVIFVHGMGGLGKTCLARKVYNGGDFQAKAWVCITQEFNFQKSLRHILDELIRSPSFTNKIDTSNLREWELVSQIHEFMMRSRSLVILDDMWERDHWDIVKKVFPIIGNRCKIIVTTRNKRLIPPLEGVPFKMDFLTEDQSWELVKKILLSTEHTRDEEAAVALLESVGREIVRKCSGVPLAVSVVGGILQQKQIRLDEWERVKEDIDMYLGLGEGVRDNTRLEEILELSYDALPYDLKYCFLMLGCFHDYKNICVDDLYMMWIGDDLISTRNRGIRESVKDVGGRYLGELVARSMVQLSEDDPRTCTLHDLMHTLCISKGRESNFVRVLDRCQQRRPGDYQSGPLWRLSISNVVGVLDGYIHEWENELSSLRFLSVQGSCSPLVEESRCTVSASIFKKLTSLRTLILRDCAFKGKSLHNRVGKLFYLKHLCIRGCLVDCIPKSIYLLPCLQIFDFSQTESHDSRPVRVIDRFYKMKTLRHLFFPGMMQIAGGGRLSLEGLERLETLHGFDSRHFWATDISILTRLQELRGAFFDINSLSAVTECMSQLNATFLEVYECDFSDGYEGSETLVKVLMSWSLVYLRLADVVSCRFPAFQQGLCLKLDTLEIMNCGELEEDVVETLGMLPSLKRLLIEETELSNVLIFRAGSRAERSCTFFFHKFKRNFDRKWSSRESLFARDFEILAIGIHSRGNPIFEKPGLFRASGHADKLHRQA